MTCHQIEAGSLLERYLAGELDAALRDEVEQHYFECDQCLAALQTLEAVRPVLAEMPPPAGARSRAKAWIALAAAATIAVVILAWPKPAVKTVAALPPVVTPAFLLAEVQPAPHEPAVYRDGAAAPAFDAAMRLYQKRQWQEAAQALEAVPGAPAAALHFAGVSRLLANDTGGALALLDRVIALGAQSPFEEEARFYRAQALLVAGRTPEARQELERVIVGKGDYEARARTLLSRF